MKSNIFSMKHALPIKVTILMIVFSLIGTACGVQPTATPSQTSQPAQAVTPSPRASELPTLEELPTEPLIEEQQPTDETLPTDETDLSGTATEEFDLSGFPTDESSLETLMAEESTPVFGTLEPFGTGEPQATEDLSGIQDTPEGNQSLEPKATSKPALRVTPVNVPLGSPGNPLILGVVIGNGEGDTTVLDSSDQLAAQLSELTGYTIQTQSVNSNVELLNGMQLGQIHMAWMQPFTYILASRRGYAKVGVVSNHFGLYAYGIQFLANSKGGFTPYFNTNTGKSTTDAAEALDQFADKRPCYVDPLSASGYVAPAGYLADSQISTSAPVFLQSHTAIVRALYVQGICDFGVTFALYGDPRTATAIQTDLPDVMQKVIVIWQSDQIIPNLNLSFNTTVPDNVANKIASSLTDFVLGEDGRQLVSSATGYEIQDLKQVDDKLYDPLRKLVTASRVNLKTLIGK